jgi:hypothetical protein
MNPRTTVLVAAVAFLLAAPLAFAQPKLVADIPFDFTIGKKEMSAGQYEIRRYVENPKALWLQPAVRGPRVVMLTHVAETDDKEYGAPPKLVFHRYGDRRFLSRVWSDGIGRQVQKSRLEREAELALGKPETLVIAAQTR